MFTSFTFFSGLFVDEFTVIHYPHHGGIGIRRHFDQIKFSLSGYFPGLSNRYDATIVAGMIDQPDLLGPNTIIYAIVATD